MQVVPSCSIVEYSTINILNCAHPVGNVGFDVPAFGSVYIYYLERWEMHTHSWPRLW
jgi:hypothetical protein